MVSFLVIDNLLGLKAMYVYEQGVNNWAIRIQGINVQGDDEKYVVMINDIYHLNDICSISVREEIEKIIWVVQ